MFLHFVCCSSIFKTLNHFGAVSTSRRVCLEQFCAAWFDSWKLHPMGLKHRLMFCSQSSSCSLSPWSWLFLCFFLSSAFACFLPLDFLFFSLRRMSLAWASWLVCRGFLVLSCLGHGFCAVRVVSASFFAFPLSLSLFSLCILFRHFLIFPYAFSTFSTFSLLSPFFLSNSYNSCKSFFGVLTSACRFVSVPQVSLHTTPSSLHLRVGRGFALTASHPASFTWLVK